MTALALLLPGCSDGGKNSRKTKRVEGVARKIDLKNNYVSMSYKTPKGDEIVLEGTVREDTEVVINGRHQKLEDVREGDAVVVIGYREGKGEDQKLVATRIEVTRAKESDWQSTTPTTQPATPPASGTGTTAPNKG